MFKQMSVSDGVFDESCQDKSVPCSLKALVSFILGRPLYSSDDSELSADISQRQAVLTVCMLLTFNSRKYPDRNTAPLHHWHFKVR